MTRTDASLWPNRRRVAWALAGPWMRSGSRAARCCRSSQLAIGAPEETDGKACFGTPAWGAAGDEPTKGVNQHKPEILAETLVERGIHHSCARTLVPTAGKKQPGGATLP